MLLGFLLPYVSRVGNGPWMPSLLFKVLLAVTSRTQSQHQDPFWVILREIESTICWFFGSPSVRCQLLGNAKPI